MPRASCSRCSIHRRGRRFAVRVRRRTRKRTGWKCNGCWPPRTTSMSLRAPSTTCWSRMVGSSVSCCLRAAASCVRVLIGTMMIRHRCRGRSIPWSRSRLTCTAMPFVCMGTPSCSPRVRSCVRSCIPGPVKHQVAGSTRGAPTASAARCKGWVSNSVDSRPERRRGCAVAVSIGMDSRGSVATSVRSRSAT